jgi:hypothetical protein
MSKFLTSTILAASLAISGFALNSAYAGEAPCCKCPKCAKDCKSCCGDNCKACCSTGTCKSNCCKPKSSVDASSQYVMASSDLATSSCCGTKK